MQIRIKKWPSGIKWSHDPKRWRLCM